MKIEKRNFRKEVERELRRIINSRPDDELTLDDIFRLALSGGKIDQELLKAQRDKEIKRFFGSILNRASKSFPDDSERKVRSFLNYTKHSQTEDGRETQLKIWKDIDETPPGPMLIAMKELKRHIDDSKGSANAILDYWNEYVRPKFHAKKIQLDF